MIRGKTVENLLEFLPVETTFLERGVGIMTLHHPIEPVGFGDDYILVLTTIGKLVCHQLFIASNCGIVRGMYTNINFLDNIITYWNHVVEI